MEGNFLAERDNDQQLLLDQIEWESNRLKNIIENYLKKQKPQ